MCGISVFLSHPGESGLPVVNGEAKHVAAELESSLDLIAHRGPDARGRWFSDDHQVGEYSLEIT
jgi:asparagine synthase (glutamine-hydrolysing)